MKIIINGLKTDDSKEIHPSPQKKKEKFKMPKYSMLFFLQRGFYARELARGKNCKHLEAHKYKGPKNLASKGH